MTTDAWAAAAQEHARLRKIADAAEAFLRALRTLEDFAAKHGPNVAASTTLGERVGELRVALEHLVLTEPVALEHLVLTEPATDAPAASCTCSPAYRELAAGTHATYCPLAGLQLDDGFHRWKCAACDLTYRHRIEACLRCSGSVVLLDNV